MEIRDRRGSVVLRADDGVTTLKIPRMPSNVPLQLLAEGLRQLRALKTLRISLSGLQAKSELEFLRGLTGLSELGISGLCSDQDLSPLATCVGLKELRLLSLNKVDVAPLASLHGLEELLLAGSVKNLKDIGGLTSLRSLEVSHNPRVSLKVLAGLHGLWVLRLTSSKVSGFEELAGLAELRTLDLRNTGIESLEILPQIKSLETLELDHCRKLQGLQGIERFTNLKELFLQELAQGVQSLHPLVALSSLQVLHLRDTRVGDDDFEPLRRLPLLSKVGVTPGPARRRLQDLARFLPNCRFTFYGGGDPVVESKGAVSILKDASVEPPIYRIDQDLTTVLDVKTNDTAEALVERDIERHHPEALTEIEFDSEGERFVVRSTSLNALHLVAKVINERVKA